MRTVLIILALVASIFTSSCADSYGTNYNYKWKLEITYTNGDKEVVFCNRNSFKENECYLFIDRDKDSSCLIMGCGFRQEVVSCNVRKFKILSLKKTLID